MRTPKWPARVESSEQQQRVEVKFRSLSSGWTGSRLTVPPLGIGNSEGCRTDQAQATDSWSSTVLRINSEPTQMAEINEWESLTLLSLESIEVVLTLFSQGSILVGLKGYWGIESGSAACKAIALPTVLSLWLLESVSLHPAISDEFNGSSRYWHQVYNYINPIQAQLEHTVGLTNICSFSDISCTLRSARKILCPAVTATEPRHSDGLWESPPCPSSCTIAYKVSLCSSMIQADFLCVPLRTTFSPISLANTSERSEECVETKLLPCRDGPPEHSSLDAQGEGFSSQTTWDHNSLKQVPWRHSVRCRMTKGPCSSWGQGIYIWSTGSKRGVPLSHQRIGQSREAGRAGPARAKESQATGTETSGLCHSTTSHTC